MVSGLVLLAPACGSGGGEYAGECATVCKFHDDGPCEGKDAMPCEMACSTETDGKSTQCALCILQNTGFGGTQCTCTGSTCTIRSFGTPPLPDQVTNQCDPMSTCNGYVVGKATDSVCKAACSQ